MRQCIAFDRQVWFRFGLLVRRPFRTRSSETPQRMPYRFKINEPVEKGFRRIAREQLDVALAELAATHIPPTGVHECRKALKRLRALVRLAASPLWSWRGAPTDESAQRNSPHAVGAPGSGRDARDGREARDGSRYGRGVHTGAVARAHSSGRSEKRRSRSTSIARPRPASCCSGKPRNSPARDFAVAALPRSIGGLEKSYGKARKAMKNAYSEPSDESFHALRKAVQWHWRQMSLLARAWPDEFAVRVSAARELSQMLGDDHDLAMLVAVAATADDISYEHKRCDRRAVSAPTAGIAQRRRISRGAAFCRDAKSFHQTHGCLLEVRPRSRPAS